MLLHFCDEKEVKCNIAGAKFRPLVVVMTCARCKRCPGLRMAGFMKFHRHLVSPIAVEVCTHLPCLLTQDLLMMFSLVWITKAFNLEWLLNL